jgi:hypothetical protein
MPLGDNFRCLVIIDSSPMALLDLTWTSNTLELSMGSFPMSCGHECSSCCFASASRTTDPVHHPPEALDGLFHSAHPYPNKHLQVWPRFQTFALVPVLRAFVHSFFRFSPMQGEFFFIRYHRDPAVFWSAYLKDASTKLENRTLHLPLHSLTSHPANLPPDHELQTHHGMFDMGG